MRRSPSSAAPGCYPTATLLALAPLARAGLIGDLVVDAKSGVSGAGRDPKPEMMFGEVNESVKAYGLGGHRHVAEIEQELAPSRPTAKASTRAPTRAPSPSTSCPHLIPMTRGHPLDQPRPPDPADHARPSSTSCTRPRTPTSRSSGSWPRRRRPSTRPAATTCSIHVRLDERTGRIIAIGVEDNLVKGAAGQAVQAFNLVHGLPETAGLDQLPLAP